VSSSAGSGGFPHGDRPIRIGVSSCLLGNPVRFDGGHKKDAFLVDQLARFVEWVPVCPEVEAGMATPRPTLQLVREGAALRMRETRSGRDHTAGMRRFARRRVRALARLDLCGYVLKRDSPSCGMERVKVRRAKGMPLRDGRGLFAEELMRALPQLPVEEEGRLCDAALRENFVERIFAYRRLRDLFAGRFRRRAAVAFHTAHKLQIMAHCPQSYAEMGRLVGGVSKLGPAEFRQRYAEAFMAALGRRATRGRNANVLQHMAGHLREHLDAPERQELSELVDDYRHGLVPLVVPLTLLRHHARRFGISYLLGQVYLDPHPKELMLRNHV
jgi:uncharacterized protein YbgA (DUF1722 family)/uncharacterized protein YbbK (DUF523 family)